MIAPHPPELSSPTRYFKFEPLPRLELKSLKIPPPDSRTPEPDTPPPKRKAESRPFLVTHRPRRPWVI
ncbi:hypothetical protein BDZ94DRAFT_1269396 [Collybia nuda]|uniref:Uncharacterized protein n=1 Tax=Collybia nuda TaxID=64659 RepID=A0A9P5XY98_9AGAR|nr:hypothetical protein BDZ94DRAFT_1269396 [Collybia nuda]